MKDKLKSDRARIQVGRISGFGLMEMSRQRLRPGMLEATTKECPHCLGTGLVRSDDSQALSILREIEEEAIRKRTKEILATVPVGISNYLMNHKRENIALIESQYGISIIIEASSSMVGTDYELEKRKTTSRIIADVFDMPTAREMEAVANIEVAKNSDDAEPSANLEDDDKPKKRRRRRRRKPRKDDITTNSSEGSDDINQVDTPIFNSSPDENSENDQEQPVESKAVKAKRKQKPKKITEIEINTPNEQTESNESVDELSDETKPKKRKRRTKAQIEADKAEAEKNKEIEKPKKPQAKLKKKTQDVSTSESKTPKSKNKTVTKAKKPTAKPSDEIKDKDEDKSVELKVEAPDKPKRRGWWSKS
jgi:ribonuclease E